MLRFVLLVLGLCLVRDTLSCVQRDFGNSSFVCVCNSTYCNFDGSTAPLPAGKVRLVTSSIDQHRNYEQILDRQENGTITHTDVNITVFVDSARIFQTVIGYGGSFTDSATINIKSLSPEAQDMLLRLYFGDEGNRYNLARVPIAGSDFSTHPYSYDDVVGDVDLVFFNLTVEDYQYKLPVMRRAIELSPDLYIFGSPWSPPSWMKTNGKFNESGELIKEMWQPYSNYLVKFFQAYESELGTQLWGFTPQNEPLGGFDPNWTFNTCGWSAEDMRDWIAQTLGPTVEAAGYRRLKLMIDDYNRQTLPSYPLPTLIDATASSYVDGIAVHWYDDTFVGPEVLDETHDLAPDKFILYTEACEGNGLTAVHVILGSWERGEHYLHDIIENTNHWSTGWVDWNLALDLQGGPNWVDNFVDSPIIIDAAADEFFVNPMYYALSLFSRNVKRDASRIYHTIMNDFDGALEATAFLNPDGTVVVIIANTSEKDYVVGIGTEDNDYVFKTTISRRSWVAVTY